MWQGAGGISGATVTSSEPLVCRALCSPELSQAYCDVSSTADDHAHVTLMTVLGNQVCRL